MKWSIRIGRWAGIDVYLHVTFLLLLAFVGATQWAHGGSVSAALDALLFFSSIFGCVLLHEFGHALAARRYGIRTRDITLLPIGGVARLERMPERPSQELWVALAGPLVNVGIAAILLLWMLVTGSWREAWSGQTAGESMATRVFLVNVMLVVFNLIPAFPMDGGRVLRALLALRMNYVKATQIAATLGQGFALLFALVGVLALLGGPGSPLLLLIALFVWIGAGQESSQVTLRSQVSGTQVRDAMLTHFFTLRPEDPLSRAVDLVLAGSQQDFPVMDGDRVIGVLTRQALLSGLSRHGNVAPVGGVMAREFETVDARESLDDVMIRWRERPMGLAPVLSGGRMVGLLTWDNVTELVMIRAALGTAVAGPARVPPVLRS